MSQTRNRLAVTLVLLPLVLTLSAPIDAANQKTVFRLYGRVTETGLMSLRRQLGYEVDGSPEALSAIGQVKLGTAAFYAGVQKGDKIVKEEASTEAINLTMQRGGKTYQIRLAAVPKRKPLLLGGTRNTQVRQYTAGLSAVDPLKVLATRQVVIVVDKSGSMSTRDCPGDVSRWQWCLEQAATLRSETAKYLKEGFTLVIFSDEHSVHQARSAESIHQVLQTNVPGGGTRMAPPIKEQLDQYFNKPAKPGQKPLLIAVISDGEPSDGNELVSALIEASEKTKPLKVCFLQVGRRSHGSEFLAFLDDELPGSGASRDVVDARDFQELEQLGLKRALAEAVLERDAPSSMRSGGLQNGSAGDIQAERRRIEQMILKLYPGKD